MIYLYVELNSYMGTTSSGITFSSSGVVVGGVSGSSANLATVTKAGNASYVGDSTPLVFINTTSSPNTTNYTLPTSPVNGTTIFIRRTDTIATGTTTLYAGGFDVIRVRTSATNVTTLNISASSFRCFFYNSGTWWEF